MNKIVSLEAYSFDDPPETDLPSVTVVTVVYNDAENIEKTLLSVLNQQYPNLEYIVIDGGSRDGTVDIIKKYKNHITHWVSERDQGIYDAMNKGIDLASGEWIIFINSYDLFYCEKTIHEVFKDAPKDADFIYGYFIRRTEGKDEHVGMYRSLNEIWRGMAFCHQTLFSKTQFLKEDKFSLKNTIISDYQFIFLNYIKGKKFVNSNKTIAIISPHRVSGNFFRKTFERWRLLRKYLNYKIDIYFLCLIFSYILNKISSKLNNFLIKKISAFKPVKNILKKNTTSIVKNWDDKNRP